MKKLICMVLFSMLAAPTFAQDRYIADKLFTYMHSGPSNQYRILGSIDAGEKVKLLDVNKDSGYSQVADERGRTGWVESRFITREVSNALRLPALEKELAEVKKQLANARQNADSEKAGLAESLEFCVTSRLLIWNVTMVISVSSLPIHKLKFVNCARNLIRKKKTCC